MHSIQIHLGHVIVNNVFLGIMNRHHLGKDIPSTAKDLIIVFYSVCNALFYRNGIIAQVLKQSPQGTVFYSVLQLFLVTLSDIA